MTHDLTQADFDRLLPIDVDLRPMIADQTRRFLKSSDYKSSLDTDIAKAEAFLRSVERKGYARKIRKRTDVPPEDSAPYNAMLKNWGRKHPKTKMPLPDGDKDFARGVFYYFFRDVPKHNYFTDIAQNIWATQDLIFQRFYYAKYLEDPQTPNFSKVCLRFHSESHVVRREFDKIWLDTHVRSPNKVHLGPVTIVLGYGDGLTQLSVQEPANQSYTTDGMPDVFKALDWRSRLSGLHGRERDAARLKEWAHDNAHEISVMLVSGPGGAGKTRLVADVVAELVHAHGWCGGFLGDADRPINGNGAGVALIIDYPEERTSVVSDILKAAARALKNGEAYDRPVRLILISRENKQAWDNFLNEPTSFISEYKLDARPCLEIADALAIVEDISLEYPDRLGRTACQFSDVEAWLKRDDTHRLPLNIVAASIHAVLNPRHAFNLDGPEILTALAEWELRRVRYYSERDFGDRNILEKLLALSLFTKIGLTKETLVKLSHKDTSLSTSSNNLLESARKTPYWRQETIDLPSRLIRLEPDRPAAIFCLKALRLDDPSPSLPKWLIPATCQDVDGLGSRISRLAFDLGYGSAGAGRKLEQQCIAMLELQPQVAKRLSRMAFVSSTEFTLEFFSEVSRRHIPSVSNDTTLAFLLHTQADKFLRLHRPEAAKQSIEQALAIRGRLVTLLGPAFLRDLLRSILVMIDIFTHTQNSESALRLSVQTISAFRRIEEIHKSRVFDSNPSQGFRCRHMLFGRYTYARKLYADFIYIFKELFSDVRSLLPFRKIKSTELEIHRIVMRGLEYYSKIPEELHYEFSFDFVYALRQHSVILFIAGNLEGSLKFIDEAVDVLSKSSGKKSENFEIEIAVASYLKSKILFELGSPQAALKLIEGAVEAYRRKSLERPDFFLPPLATMLVLKADTLLIIGEPDLSIRAAQECTAIWRQMFNARPERFLPDLVSSLNNEARIFYKSHRQKEALLVLGEAIAELRPFFLSEPRAHKPLMESVLHPYLELCTEMSVGPEIDLIEPVIEKLGRA